MIVLEEEVVYKKMCKWRRWRTPSTCGM